MIDNAPNQAEEDDQDEELSAIKTVLTALEPLKPAARDRVVAYVFGRLGIAAAEKRPEHVHRQPAAQPAGELISSPHHAPANLRSLVDQKKPKSANQMVAVLGYYLAHLAPLGEQRQYIVADDIQKYFLQANFPVPTGPHNMTLVNAKNAGYLDVAAPGQYRLNPVGLNLVTHKLPAVEGSVPRRTRGSKKKKKAAARKKKAGL